MENFLFFYKFTITLIWKPHIKLAKVRILDPYKVISIMSIGSVNFNYCTNVLSIFIMLTEH